MRKLLLLTLLLVLGIGAMNAQVIRQDTWIVNGVWIKNSTTYDYNFSPLYTGSQNTILNGTYPDSIRIYSSETVTGDSIKADTKLYVATITPGGLTPYTSITLDSLKTTANRLKLIPAGAANSIAPAGWVSADSCDFQIVGRSSGNAGVSGNSTLYVRVEKFFHVSAQRAKQY